MSLKLTEGVIFTCRGGHTCVYQIYSYVIVGEHEPNDSSGSRNTGF